LILKDYSKLAKARHLTTPSAKYCTTTAFGYSAKIENYANYEGPTHILAQ